MKLYFALVVFESTLLFQPWAPLLVENLDCITLGVFIVRVADASLTASTQEFVSTEDDFGGAIHHL